MRHVAHGLVFPLVLALGAIAGDVVVDGTVARLSLDWANPAIGGFALVSGTPWGSHGHRLRFGQKRLVYQGLIPASAPRCSMPPCGCGRAVRWYTRRVAGRDEFELPVFGQAVDETPEEAPSCSPRIYVSNEEAAVVAAMHAVKERATAVREHLAGSLPDDERGRLEAELEDLRRRFSELSIGREAAYRRKMVMLGHLPPDALRK